MSFHVRRLREEPSKPKFPWKRYLIGALAIAEPLHGLYASWKKRREQEHRQHRRVLFLKRAFLVLVAVLIALVFFVGITRGLSALKILSIDTIVSVTGADLPTDENGFTNILLIGEGDEAGQRLTDTIIVASIDVEKTKSVVMLSFPRDMYFLKTEKMGKGRLNSMYRDYSSYLWYEKGMEKEDASVEALSELATELGRILEMPIHHAVKVNFEGFVQAVDTLGGVDLDVPYDILDTEYPDGNYGYETFAIDAGLQHLDGETALKYARSRHTTSDFGRSARQQQLLAALSEQAKGSDLVKDPSAIMDLLKILSENVESTLSVREMIGLADLGQKIDRDRVITMQLNDRNALYDTFIEPGGFLYTPPRDLFDGASVLLPISIPEYPVTWKQIKALSSLIFKQRGIYVDQPHINVLNGGAKSGLARKLANELIRYGFAVDEIANASVDGKMETSMIFAKSEADEVQTQFFSLLLGIPKGVKPAEMPIEEANQITIVIGKDYAYSPIQNLLPDTQ